MSGGQSCLNAARFVTAGICEKSVGTKRNQIELYRRRPLFPEGLQYIY